MNERQKTQKKTPDHTKSVEEKCKTSNVNNEVRKHESLQEKQRELNSMKSIGKR